MTIKNAEWIAAERADGARCYRQKTPWLDWKSQHWKDGYASAQNDALKIKRAAARPVGAPAPLIDVRKLERMRMGGR